MDNYPGNSQSGPKQPSKEDQRKRLTPVVTNTKVRKKPLRQRFADAFTGEDGRSVLEHVMLDVLVPAAKDMIRDAGNEALARALYGDSRPSRSYTSYDRGGPRGSYGGTRYDRPGFMQDPRERDRRQESRRIQSTGRVDYRDILIPSRVEADEVLDQLFAALEQFGQVSVADVLDLMGATGEFTDAKYGWTDLRGARVERVRNDGYVLNLPREEQLD
jgi:hypothetical protein